MIETDFVTSTMEVPGRPGGPGGPGGPRMDSPAGP